MPTIKKAKKVESVEEIPPAKIKKEFDLDGADVFGGEKVEETDAFGEEAEEVDDLAEEAELDQEELNPFGDKWEE